MDINVHRFGFPARRGLFYLQEQFKDIVFEVGREPFFLPLSSFSLFPCA
jgi:hypothetical protein